MTIHVPTPAPHPIAAPKQAGAIDRLVGRRIQALRKAKGLSQTALGQSVGVTFQQVQKYERGANRIGAGRRWDIAQLLDVPVATLFEDDAEAGEDAPPPSTEASAP